MKHYPSGKFICTRNENRYKWYECKEHQYSYIPKSNRQYAQKLCAKKYLTLLLQDLSLEKKAIDSYLSKHAHCKNEAAQLLTSNSEYQSLLSPLFTPLSVELKDWADSSYEQNPKHPDQLLFKTSSGHIVRSKSESLIDMLLYTNKIPFRYECALHLGETVIYPDFTIRHPQTGELFYWEHFGLMNKPSYRQSMLSKLQLYTSHNIIPSIQLITTYETQEHPLNPALVENIINQYFL